MYYQSISVAKVYVDLGHMVEGAQMVLAQVLSDGADERLEICTKLLSLNVEIYLELSEFKNHPKHIRSLEIPENAIPPITSDAPRISTSLTQKHA